MKIYHCLLLSAIFSKYKLENMRLSSLMKSKEKSIVFWERETETKIETERKRGKKGKEEEERGQEGIRRGT